MSAFCFRINNDILKKNIIFLLVPWGKPLALQVMKQEQGCLDVNVPPDINMDRTSSDVTVQVYIRSFN